MEFLSDYEIQPDGTVFVEFDGEYGRHRHFLPQAEADAMVARNQAYLDSHPEEVEQYFRDVEEDLARCRQDEEDWMRAREEAAENERLLAEEQYIFDLTKRACRRRHSRKCLTFRPERSIL